MAAKFAGLKRWPEAVDPRPTRISTAEGSCIRAQSHLIQALSITQAEHTIALRDLSEAVAGLRQAHGAKLDQIITMLDQLIEVDE